MRNAVRRVETGFRCSNLSVAQSTGRRSCRRRSGNGKCYSWLVRLDMLSSLSDDCLLDVCRLSLRLVFNVYRLGRIFSGIFLSGVFVPTGWNPAEKSRPDFSSGRVSWRKMSVAKIWRNSLYNKAAKCFFAPLRSRKYFDRKHEKLFMQHDDVYYSSCGWLRAILVVVMIPNRSGNGHQSYRRSMTQIWKLIPFLRLSMHSCKIAMADWISLTGYIVSYSIS